MLLFICCIAEKLEDKCYFITTITELCVSCITGPATEFGAVIVFTCKNSCWDGKSKTKQEMVLLQTDPDHHLFK